MKSPFRQKYVSFAMSGLLLTACSDEAGVRVVINLAEESWSSRRSMTHVRVEAEADGQRAVACLFPKTAVPEAFQVPEADVDDEYACANAENMKIDLDLAYASWDFGSERSVNFVVADAQAVTITASGGFAGRIGLFTASTEIEAESTYSPVTLELVPDEEKFSLPPGCRAQLSSVRSGRFTCPPHRLTSCVLEPGSESGTGVNLHTAAVSELPLDGCRIDNAPDLVECPNEQNEQVVAFGTVFVVPPKGQSSKGGQPEGLVTAKGRFARCAPGSSGPDCPLTADCTPPSTSVFTAIFPTGGGAPQTAKPGFLSCLPPSVVPVEFALRVEANAEVPFNIGYLRQDHELTEDRCFFDLMEFDIDTIESP